MLYIFNSNLNHLKCHCQPKALIHHKVLRNLPVQVLQHTPLSIPLYLDHLGQIISMSIKLNLTLHRNPLYTIKTAYWKEFNISLSHILRTHYFSTAMHLLVVWMSNDRLGRDHTILYFLSSSHLSGFRQYKLHSSLTLYHPSFPTKKNGSSEDRVLFQTSCFFKVEEPSTCSN